MQRVVPVQIRQCVLKHGDEGSQDLFEGSVKGGVLLGVKVVDVGGE